MFCLHAYVHLYNSSSLNFFVEEIMTPRERENAIEDQISAPMDFAMILNATDNFSQEIGHGGFGYVYKVTQFF